MKYLTKEALFYFLSFYSHHFVKKVNLRKIDLGQSLYCHASCTLSRGSSQGSLFGAKNPLCVPLLRGCASLEENCAFC